MTEATDTPDLAVTPGEQFLLDAFEPDNRQDPYPFYARFREQGSALDAGNNLWVTLDHASAHTLLRSRNTSSDERTSTFFTSNIDSDPKLQQWAEKEPMMLFTDPPDHTRLRALVSAAFTPRTVEKLVPRIHELTGQLLDNIAQQDQPVDLVEHLAYPVPVVIICELLGVPREDEAIFGAWSKTFTKAIDPNILRSEEDEKAMLQAEVELDAYVTTLLAQRTANPQDDLLSALITARDGDDQLSQDELIRMVQLLLLAGHETTVNLIGNGIVALLQNRSELERWQADPSLAKGAVDELLRYNSPVQMAMRVILEDTPIGDQILPAGEQVLTLLGSANRDPLVFDDPDRLDITRANAHRHMSFGGGIHHCLGMSLARWEGQIVLGSLIERFPNLELADAPTLRDRFVLRGYEHIPVAVTP